jgi:phosphate transport system substrate-binding protein
VSRWWLGGLLTVIAAGSYAASVDPALLRYEPRAVEIPLGASYVAPDGAVAVVGYNDMRELMQAWVARFVESHPRIRFALDLRGTRFAPAALAAGTSALAPMGAEFTPLQLADYRDKAGADPIAFRVAHASLNPRALSGPLAIFVHRDNPIASLTLEQLSRAFAGEATRWGDLGEEGEWASRRINVYGVARGTPLALSFEANAMGGRALATQMKGYPQSADVVQRVGSDPDALGFAAAMRATASVRVVPIALRAGSEAIAPTPENIIAGNYPLDRFLLIYAPRPVTALVREFMRLVLSREGQAMVAATPQGYVPLSAAEAAAERAKLE